MSEQLGEKVSGRISILTHLRTFGYCFNPVTFYYLWAEVRKPHMQSWRKSPTRPGEKNTQSASDGKIQNRKRRVSTNSTKNFMSPHLLEWMWNTTGDFSTRENQQGGHVSTSESSGLLFCSFVSETKKDFFPKSILCSLSFSLHDHKSNDGHLLECTTALA